MLTIKMRMFFIIGLIFLLFSSMIWFSLNISGEIRDLAIEDSSKAMLDGQKAKIKVATHSIALAIGKSIEGVDDVNEKVEIIRKAVDDIRFETDKSGYYFVYQETTNIALPPKKSLQGKDLKDTKDANGVYLVRDLRDLSKKGGGFLTWIWPKPGAGDVPKLGYAEMIPGTNYWIGTGVYLDNIEKGKINIRERISKKVKRSIIEMTVISGSLFIVITIFCFIIIIAINRGLKRIILNVQDIAEGEGDLTKRIEIKSKDELAELSKWFNLFLDKLQKIIGRISEESASVDKSSNELSLVSEDMTSGAQNVSGQAERVAAATEEMSSSMNSVASAMEECSNNANLVASAAEEMNSTINEIARNAEQSKDISEQAAIKTSEAGSILEKLNEAAKSIGQVTETITEISEQTSLLALNATIEAARAGEAGKGFAVVANEIKDLSTQTAEATLDIKSQIENIQNASNTTISSIQEVIEVINSTKEIVSTIAVAVTEQSSATQEISSNIEQLSLGIGEVNENVNQSSHVASQITKEIADVNKASSEMSNNSLSVKDSSSQLKSMAEKLKDIVDTFII